MNIKSKVEFSELYLVPPHVYKNVLSNVEEETENEFVIGDFVHQDIFGTEEIIAVLFLVFAALYAYIRLLQYILNQCRNY